MASGYTNTVVITRSNHKHYTNIIPGKKKLYSLGGNPWSLPKGPEHRVVYGYNPSQFWWIYGRSYTEKKLTRNNQWIGLRENTQENPIFNGKIDGFRLRFSRENQSIETKFHGHVHYENHSSKPLFGFEACEFSERPDFGQKSRVCCCETWDLEGVQKNISLTIIYIYIRIYDICIESCWDSKFLFPWWALDAPACSRGKPIRPWRLLQCVEPGGKTHGFREILAICPLVICQIAIENGRL